MRNVITAVALVLLLGASGPACTPRLFQAALVTAAVVGTVALLAHHDAHFHDEYCGHARAWQDGRWVYYYHDHWEYYDPATGGWYYYEQ